MRESVELRTTLVIIKARKELSHTQRIHVINLYSYWTSFRARPWSDSTTSIPFLNHPLCFVAQTSASSNIHMHQVSFQYLRPWPPREPVALDFVRTDPVEKVGPRVPPKPASVQTRVVDPYFSGQQEKETSTSSLFAAPLSSFGRPNEMRRLSAAEPGSCPAPHASVRDGKGDAEN
jgi:hypothetical protein